MRNFDPVIFDCDGVLVDIENLPSVRFRRLLLRPD
jgi:beta-phosphoglucomutase-like phosphatase (HAD superfamily)